MKTKLKIQAARLWNDDAFITVGTAKTMKEAQRKLESYQQAYPGRRFRIE